MMIERLSSAARLGVLGGTFDPIHYGHLAIAEETRVQYQLDAVLFIPAGEPPHKPRWQADAEHRYQMTVLATADHPDFYVSRMEIDRPGISYTIDTLRALLREYPQAQLYFIVGADSALDFPNWRDPQGILQCATVVAATRPGYLLDHLPLKNIPNGHQIEVLTVPGLDISSTELRARISAKKSLRYLVPRTVAAYISKTELYQNS